MMKKLTSIFFAVVLCVNTTATALAATPVECYNENENVQVINRSSSISEQALDELANDISASLTYDDGTSVPVATTVIVEDVDRQTAKENRLNASNTYRVTAETKVESDSDNKNNEGVNASVHISLYWEDRLGPNNYFKSVNGGINLIQGTISKSILRYGDLNRTINDTVMNLGAKRSFNVSVNKEVFAPHASYHVFFDGAIFELNVSVTPSIFD